MKKQFAGFMLAAGVVGSAQAQVVINEVMATGVGTDSQEFVELYGPAGTDLGIYQLELINGAASAAGAAYDTIDLAGQTIPSDGFFVIAGGTTVPNTDLVDPNGPTTGWLQNGDPDAVVLRRKSDSVIVDAVAYFTNYAAPTPGSPANGGLLAGQYEGAGGTGAGGDDSANVQTGTAASVAQDENSFGRFPDGADSNNNQVDIITFSQGRSPGASNATGLNLTLPFTEDFGVAGLTRKWQRYYTDVVLETAATAVPASIPNSPDPVTPASWASTKDNAGGGDEIGIADFLGKNYHVSAYLYCGPISAPLGDGDEIGGIAGRVNFQQNNITADAWDLTQPVGTYGDTQYGLYANYATGVIDAVKVDKTLRTVVASSAPVAAGWHKLGLNFNEGTVEYYIDDVLLGSLTSETPRYGYIALGYRESSGTVNGNVRNNFDAVTVTAPLTSNVKDWSIY